MNKVIIVKDLEKEFKVYNHKNGFLNSVKELFNREYEMKKAVNKINFEIEEGEIVGYLGPNGAGKSTTIKMLSGVLVPSSGLVEVAGLNPHLDRIKNAKNIGVVFGQRSQLIWDVPVIDSFNLARYLYNIPKEKFEKNLNEFIELLGIDEFIKIPVRQLSLGQKMRAELCYALLHEPKILFLDEPTIGLDVVVKNKVQEFIKKINRNRKVTIILTTHDIGDIEKLCDRSIVIDKGQIIYDGTIEELKGVYNKYGITSLEEIIRSLYISSDRGDLRKYECSK